MPVYNGGVRTVVTWAFAEDGITRMWDSWLTTLLRKMKRYATGPHLRVSQCCFVVWSSHGGHGPEQALAQLGQDGSTGGRRGPLGAFLPGKDFGDDYEGGKFVD